MHTPPTGSTRNSAPSDSIATHAPEVSPRSFEKRLVLRRLRGKIKIPPRAFPPWHNNHRACLCTPGITQQEEQQHMKTETTELPVLARELDALATINIDDDSICTDTTALSPTEKKMLENHEAIIEQSKLALLEVGRSLLAIQRAKLYRGKYTSFNEYCRKRWGFGRQRGYELINAVTTSEELAAEGVDVQQLTERQLRPLTTLKDTHQRMSALTRAQELAGEAKMTSRHVQDAVDELKGVKKAIVIDVEPLTAITKGSVTITTTAPQTTSIEDIRIAIDGIRDLASTFKLQDRFFEPLERLEAMIEELLRSNLGRN